MRIAAVACMAVMLISSGVCGNNLSEEYYMPKGEYAAIMLDLVCLRESIKLDWTQDINARYYQDRSEIGITIFGDAESIEEAQAAVMNIISKIKIKVDFTLKDKGIVFDFSDIWVYYLSRIDSKIQLKYNDGKFYTADFKEQ
jgi:hypothetical protein